MIENKIFIDLRGIEAYCEQHISGSYAIPFSEQIDYFIELIEENLPKVFVISKEQDKNVALKKKGTSYSKEFIVFEDEKDNYSLDLCISVDLEEFALDYKYDEFYLIDLRPEELFEKEHIEHASSLPLEELANLIIELDTQQTYYLYSDTPEEACFAASLFKKHGLHFIRVALAPYPLLQSAINA